MPSNYHAHRVQGAVGYRVCVPPYVDADYCPRCYWQDAEPEHAATVTAIVVAVGAKCATCGKELGK